AWLARRGRLATLGLAGPVPGRALLAAVALGAFLGGPLLVSPSLTLGVRLRPDPGGVLSALAYDAGANVLAAECFFRGALFNRAPAPLVLRHGGRPRDGGVRGALSRRSAPAEEHRVGRRRGVLPGAAERGELLALLVVGKPRSRRRRRAPLLRGVPAAR